MIKLLLQEEMYQLVLGYPEDCLNKCVTRIMNGVRELPSQRKNRKRVYVHAGGDAGEIQRE